MQVQDRNATNNKFTESATTVCILYALSEYICSYQFDVEYNITNNHKTIVQLQTEKHLLMNKIRDTIHYKADEGQIQLVVGYHGKHRVLGAHTHTEFTAHRHVKQVYHTMWGPQL